VGETFRSATSATLNTDESVYNSGERPCYVTFFLQPLEDEVIFGRDYGFQQPFISFYKHMLTKTKSCY
jgi:hypothetical protein